MQIDMKQPILDKNDQLAAQLRAYGKPVTVCGSVAEGVRAALDRTSADGALVAFGSLYMAGDVRACFGRS